VIVFVVDTKNLKTQIQGSRARIFVVVTCVQLSIWAWRHKIYVSMQSGYVVDEDGSLMSIPTAIILFSQKMT
jgi:hypothetical protein